MQNQVVQRYNEVAREQRSSANDMPVECILCVLNFDANEPAIGSLCTIYFRMRVCGVVHTIVTFCPCREARWWTYFPCWKTSRWRNAVRCGGLCLRLRRCTWSRTRTLVTSRTNCNRVWLWWRSKFEHLVYDHILCKPQRRLNVVAQ